MNTHFYVTKAIRRWWDKEKLGPVFDKKLGDFLSNKVKSPECIHGTEVHLSKFNGVRSRPTFVWFERHDEENSVFVLRGAYVHKDYEKYVDVTKKDEWNSRFALEDEEEKEVAEYLEHLKNGEDTGDSVVELPTLTGAERNFISSSLDINQKLFDETVYETEEWINFITNEDNGFNDFYEVASQIEYHIYDHLGSAEGWQTLNFKDYTVVIYHRNSEWILAGIYKTEEFDLATVQEREIPADLRRGYPYTFLGDELRDEWRLMETEKKSNMVLSSQQIDLVSKDVEYPLFITGRAGSGKSTVLQYIFAEIILRYKYNLLFCDQKDSLLPPVYLSYSDNLIQDARHLTRVLLEKNSSYMEKAKELSINFTRDIEPEFEDMFYVFQDLVKKCIKDNEEGKLPTRFSSNKYISFAKFNRLWSKRFGKLGNSAKEYGPSISWHVIRTFIKGWSSYSFTSPEEYKKLPDDRHSVNDRTFQLVYEKVWNNWYKDIDGWDDQDLVRYCLENEYAGEQYSAVFCDEAQDFTRIELDFILQLSSFANRNLNRVENVKKVPFVFAGDEFQTLNPTGFSWDSLKGYFTERLFDLTGLSDLKNQSSIADPIELSENFRSTTQVVKLANRIQLLRATRFNNMSEPQSPHFSKYGNPVVCLNPDDKAVFEELRSKGVILIIPAADGESIKDYIQRSALKEMIEFEDGAPKGITILNPTQAKGLEYPNVAIYGFDCEGPYNELSLSKLTKWYANPVENKEKDIALKYQVSNAYVAVTRAGSNLFIIDKFDRNSFWAFAFNHSDEEFSQEIDNLKKSMLHRLSLDKQKQWNDDFLGMINYGDVEQITDENIKYLNSNEYRDTLENRAEAINDIELMRQAACRHKEAGRKKDEARCRAKAYVFEDEYLKAAEQFVNAELYDDAVKYYWLALAQSPKSEIVVHLSRLQDKTSNPKARLCVKARQRLNLREVKEVLNEVEETLSTNEEEVTNVNAWQFIINESLNKIVPVATDSREYEPIVKLCTLLKEHRVKVDYNELAAAFFTIQEYQFAANLWEEIEKAKRPTDYYNAKVNTTNYPKKIEFYEGTDIPMWRTIVINEYKNHRAIELTEIQKSIIATCILNDKSAEVEDFIKFLPFMLRSATSKRAADDIAAKANSLIDDPNILNRSVIRTVIETRFTDLTRWKKPNIRFEDTRATSLFHAIDLIKNIRRPSTDYWNRNVKKKSFKEVCNNLRAYANQPFSPFVFIEFGQKVEKVFKVLDVIEYYTHAQKMSDDERFIRAMKLRLILALEKCAEGKNDEQKLVQAKELRASIKAQDVVIPQFAEIPDWAWEELFEYACSIKGDVRSDKAKVAEETVAIKTDDVAELPNVEEANTSVKEEPQTSSDEPANSMTSNVPDEENAAVEVPRTTNKQTFKFGDYEITYYPKNHNLKIEFKSDSEDASIVIKDGKFSKEQDLTIDENGVIVFSETQALTPFFIEIEPALYKLMVIEDQKLTGIILAFSKY